MGKTVTTYLIDGDPKGTQYVFISNKICQMFVVPRSELAYLNEQEKLQKPAFYILIGEDEQTKPQAYIGETENFRERVKDHENKKIVLAEGAHLRFERRLYDESGRAVSGAPGNCGSQAVEHVRSQRKQADAQGS